MATINQSLGTANALSFLTTELDSLADGSYTASETAVDFGVNPPFRCSAEAKLTGSASGTGFVEIYMLWSNDNIDFSNQSDNDRNGELVAVIDMNATTETKKIFSFPVLARYGIMRAKNASGAALAANAGDILGTEIEVNSA